MVRLAIIGFGEAGSTSASVAMARNIRLRVYDRAPKQSEYAATGVEGRDSAAAVLADAEVVLSLVTADQALVVAEQAAPHLASDALWLDMNSVAPDTKRAAARIIEQAGGRYVDVAVMSPMLPARAATPLLLAGGYAPAGEAALRAIGFTNVRIVGEGVGRASSIKMIRSVMVKGIEALTAECVIAASAAGVLDEVLASLDASPSPPAWEERADYNLDRMMVHGLRRAAEMEEVAKTLDALGTGATMTRGTVTKQRLIGAAGVIAPPAGLEAKLRILYPEARADAA